MDDDDLAEMEALRKTENYKRHEELVGGPRKKAKLEEDDSNEIYAPVALGQRRGDDDDIIYMRKGQGESDSSDSGEDFGPLPPPEAKQSSDSENPVLEASPTSAYESYRKRIVDMSAKEATSDASAAPKKKEGWYVYGKEDLPDSLTAESESQFEERLRHVKAAMPSGDYDMDVLMDDENAKRLPIRFEAFLKGHTKPISALDLDPKGVRLVSTSADFSLKLWDFTSMDPSLQSFRKLEPTENNIVHTVEWSKSGDKILIAANTPQAQILDREGRKIMETARGYQYTTDMTHTTGHISPITRAVWMPSDPNHSFATCGHDATVRFWNVDEPKKHKVLIKLKTDRGLSTLKPLCLGFSENGSNFAVASDDGSIQLFPTKGPHMKPTVRIGDAHVPNSQTSWLQFVPNSDDKLFVSRGGDGDDTLKVWDVRQTKSPIVAFPGLSNRFPATSVAFSPNGEIMATGTSTSRRDEPGSIFFFHMKSLNLVKIMDVSSESVISLRWHKETNQLIAGCGDGSISMLFDPEISKKGVMTSLAKQLRKVSTQKTSEIDVVTPFAPQALNDRQRKAAALKDPHKSHKPLQPITGRGSAGLLGSNLKADMMKKLMHGRTDVHADPREALLKHAKESDSSTPTVLDYEGLERINQEEQNRAEALARLQRSKERK